MITRRRFLAASALAPMAFGIRANATPRVVVVGGGFGGCTAARYIRKLAPSAEILLVDPARSFITCPFSNLVLAGMRDIDSISFSYRGLQAEGIELVPSFVEFVDIEKRKVALEENDALLAWDYLVLSPGVQFRYEGIEGASERTGFQLPHAWKGGFQTLRLKSQLEKMKPGGVFVIAAPDNPYRCPPGPYERASLVAEYFKTHNPKAKIIIVDAKDNFTKKELFMEGWEALYPGMIDWVGVSETGSLRRVDGARKRFFTDFDEFQADVGNLIPPQRAAELVTDAGLDGGRGWCEVDPASFESRLAKNVYILGDAVNANPMPKSAFSANNQAKVCAAAIAAKINGKEAPEAFLLNTCYSLLARDYGISISGAYRVQDDQLIAVPETGGQSASGAAPEVRKIEARYTYDWYRAITRDTFGRS
ncbi:MAG: FAD-dependent oxidoreductase [Pseudomonadales bacterium]|nr:FAD-dependent oxidoreductase [Pseudomonadales bacterium]